MSALQDFNSLIGSLQASSKYSDVTIRVGDKSFPSHKLVLALNSPKFASQLYPEKKSETSTDELKLSDVDAKEFAIILRCLYQTKVTLSAEEMKELDVLLALAQKLEVPKVQKGLVDALTSELKEDTVLPLLIRLSKLDSSVLQTILNFIAANAHIIAQKPEFLHLSESQVAGIIGNESLEMTEINAFKRALDWGKAECARRKLDADQKNLATVLAPILAHIRFPLMSFTEISQTVGPAGVVRAEHLVQIFTILSMKGKFPSDFPYKSVPRIPVVGSTLPPAMDLDAPLPPPM